MKARIVLAVLLALGAVGCNVRHCAMWNLLPAFGLAFAEPICSGGQAPAPALEDILKAGRP